MFDLTGKTALVTGSTQGIGFEIASLLSKQGAKVFVSGAESLEKCITVLAKKSQILCLLERIFWYPKKLTSYMKKRAM